MIAAETEGRDGKGEHGKARTREVKMAVAFTQTSLDENGRPVRDPRSSSYLATFAPAAGFGTLMAAEARRRALPAARPAPRPARRRPRPVHRPRHRHRPRRHHRRPTPAWRRPGHRRHLPPTPDPCTDGCTRRHQRTEPAYLRVTEPVICRFRLRRVGRDLKLFELKTMCLLVTLSDRAGSVVAHPDCDKCPGGRSCRGFTATAHHRPCRAGPWRTACLRPAHRHQALGSIGAPRSAASS